MKLNIGCGYDIRPKPWVNIDQFCGPGVDLVTDLNNAKLPYENDSVDEVVAIHVFEHVLRWEYLLKEIHRVLKPGGTIQINVPYMCVGAFHVRQFNENTMYLFTIDNNGPHHTRETSDEAIFDKVSMKVNWRLLYNYHFMKYLHLNIGIPASKQEIVWILRKRAS